MTLRPYQAKWVGDILQQYAQGARAVLGEKPTGAGKTKSVATIIRDHAGAACVMAHRQELVGQLSVALAKEGVRHNIIAAAETKRDIAAEHIEKLGQCFFDPGSRVAVASIQTIVRAPNLEAWARQVTLLVGDEGHHFVRGGQFGAAIDMFTHPALRLLLVTATPGRADGKGLGCEPQGDGYAQVIVPGPRMRWLIGERYLSDYRYICPPSDMVLDPADIGASGDWSTDKLRKAARGSHIVGDVVSHYKRYATGRLGITFCTDVETASETTAAFCAAGVRASLLTGKTPGPERRAMLKAYERRQLDQLVTVDIVSEGFDLPAIECVSLARPTMSLGLYMQQVGRGLRPSGTDRAVILDHVNNIVRHDGPPDRPRTWSLARRDKRSKGASDAVPYTVCIACFEPYERIHRTCPHCGHYPEPAGRSSPRLVDGDLHELDEATLAALRGEVDAVDLPDWQYRDQLAARGVPAIGVMGHLKTHRAVQEAQSDLRAWLGVWGHRRMAEGYNDSQIQRLFWHRFGLSIMEAKALREREALALAARVSAAP